MLFDNFKAQRFPNTWVYSSMIRGSLVSTASRCLNLFICCLCLQFFWYHLWASGFAFSFWSLAFSLVARLLCDHSCYGLIYIFVLPFKRSVRWAQVAWSFVSILVCSIPSISIHLMGSSFVTCDIFEAGLCVMETFQDKGCLKPKSFVVPSTPSDNVLKVRQMIFSGYGILFVHLLKVQLFYLTTLEAEHGFRTWRARC
jgi:hypothetical protein